MNESTEDGLYEKARLGDTMAYERLKTPFLDFKPEAFFVWSKYFADTINYHQANFDVFAGYIFKNNLHGSDTINISAMEKADRNEALRYFLKAKRLKVEGVDDYKVYVIENGKKKWIQ